LMSRFFPHASYAEDQPLAKTILTTHVLTRALTTGSLIGTGVFSAQAALARFRTPAQPASAAAEALPKAATAAVKFDTARLLRTTGTSSLITLGLISLALAGRMYGREEIEWKDRSWRILENQGQLETDDWTLGGVLAGVGVAAGRIGVGALGWRGALGGAGLGSVAGMFGYLGWRHGVKGGFEEKQ
jgi:hypothetical protein